MFTISKEHLDETRIEKREPGKDGWDFVDIIGGDAPKMEPLQDTGATQRVFVNQEQISTSAPTPPPTPRPRQNPPQRRTLTPEQRKKNAEARKKKERNTIIAISAGAAAVLIIVVIILISALSSKPDTGLIYDNIFAAGVDLGGMTKEQAVSALHKATDDTYSKLDMTVQVLDASITLSPKDTGARLDVEAVAQAAYDYGRTGSRSEREKALSLLKTTAYALPLDEHLTLDTAYIQQQLDKLGEEFSVSFVQSSHQIIDGTRPTTQPDPATVDLTKAYETLRICIGVPEYEYRSQRVMEQIMDAYSQNLFQVTGECKVRAAPDALDCEAIFAQYCTAPVDAVMDPDTYAVTPEVYGYGIALTELKKLVSEAKYGNELLIPLCFLEPDVTTKNITQDLFQDVLATYQTTLSSDSGWNTNMDLACQAINGLILKSGEEFSFNTVVGEPTAKGGYKAVSLYVGKSMTELIGGGTSQVASTLYYCALRADLGIVERHAHTYAPSFVPLGLDAQVYYGTMDLRFKNTTSQPIRIEAAISGNNLHIRLIGTDTRDYTVDLQYEVTKTKKPEKEYITLTDDSPGNHKDGELYAKGITGYDVSVYRITTDKLTGRPTDNTLVSQSSYAKRNEVVIHVVPAPNTEPTDPTVPDTTGTTEPDATQDSSDPES